MIISDNDVTLEAHEYENGIYVIMHNNKDNQSIMDYQELTLTLTEIQRLELIAFLSIVGTKENK